MARTWSTEAMHTKSSTSAGGSLRQLHSLDPYLLGERHDETDVIQHGDFGPKNILLKDQSFDVAAVLDWEFAGVGPAITDIAWCEWVVRMHHPDAVSTLPDFFAAYGTRPPWKERQSEMLRRCHSLESFARRSDPAGRAVTVWKERATAAASWIEKTRGHAATRSPRFTLSAAGARTFSGAKE